jgi:ankyrin repeat protein
MDTTSAIRKALYRRDHGEAARLATDTQTDVFEAAALGDSERLQGLLDADPSLAQAWSDDGFTALHLAAYLGGPAALQVLIGAGADVNAVARNDMQVQPLHSAAAHGSVESVEQLLVAGADPNGRQNGGWTPLDEAIITKNEPMAVLMREHGAELSGNQLPGE